MTDDDLPIKPATRLVQAGRRAEWTKGVVNVPVWRGSTVLYDNVAHMRATGAGDLHEKLFYGRKGLPTQWSLADALTSLEPGRRRPSSILRAWRRSRRRCCRCCRRGRIAAGRQRL